MDENVLVSFDVLSLFILIVELVNKNWNIISAYIGIKGKQLNVEILCLCLDGYFKYNNNYYKQLFGVVVCL